MSKSTLLTILIQLLKFSSSLIYFKFNLTDELEEESELITPTSPGSSKSGLHKCGIGSYKVNSEPEHEDICAR